MKLKPLTEMVEKNSLVENTNTGDIAVSPEFVGELIHQTYSKSILPLITSVMPMSKPTGIVYSIQAYYSGRDINPSSFASMKVLELNSNYVGVVGDTLTFNNSATAQVEYIEGSKILVNVLSGTINNTNTFSTYTIKNVFSGRTSVKKIFKDYSIADENSTMNTVKFNSVKSTVEAVTRKIKSTVTREALQDITSQYGEKADQMLADMMSNEIVLEMDKEVIEYMKSIANQTSDLVVTSDSSADMIYALYPIIARINKEATALAGKHGKNIRGFVVVSPEIAGALVSTGYMAFGKSGNLDVQLLTDNNNLLGRMLQYIDVVIDKYADENYVLVGWKEDTVGSAGVIFSPYMIQQFAYPDPETGREILMCMNRYGYTRNAFDEGGDIGSDYFTLFNVDLSGVAGY